MPGRAAVAAERAAAAAAKAGGEFEAAFEAAIAKGMSEADGDKFTDMVASGKISEADLAECRATFDQLDVTGQGILSAEDLELLTQRRLQRLGPRLRQRRFSRLLRSLGFGYQPEAA